MLIATLLLAAATAENGGAANDSRKRVRCVREEVIGSLVARRRVCHTVEEWERIRKGGNDEARRIIQPGTLNDQNG